MMNSFAAWEVELGRHYADRLERWVDLCEQARMDGGHWGSESEEFADLIGMVAVREELRPVEWWRA